MSNQRSTSNARLTLAWDRPKFYREQLAAIFCEERWALVEASTKSGKTVTCLGWQSERVISSTTGANHWWVAPYRGTAAIAYERAKRFLPRDGVECVDSLKLIRFAHGPVWWFKHGEIPDTLYGEDVHSCVIDEASRLREASWHAIRSTLTATRAPCRIIGNVKGRKNWFYRLCRKAQAGAENYHYAKLTAYDAIRAGVLDAAEIEDARDSLPEPVFRELYLAEPSDDASNPFGLDHVRACTAPLSDGEPVAWGWDLGKAVDETVGIALDVNRRACRFVGWMKPWVECEDEIVERTGSVPAMADSTGVGDPIVERLQLRGRNFEGFNFGARERNLGGFNKQKLIERLATAIRKHEITFPPEVAAQCEEFEYTYTRTGVRYAAPDGAHDDRVMALALALLCWDAHGCASSGLEITIPPSLARGARGARARA